MKLTFFAAADMHYTTKSVSGTRYHAKSLEKLRFCMDIWKEKFDFIVNMGDATDAAEGYLPQEDCFRAIYDTLRESGKPVYSLIGNHDTAAEKCRSTVLLHIPGRYYAVETEDWLCLFLDGSLNDPDDPERPGLIDWENCWIDNAQMKWLSETVNTAKKPILVFCHPCFALKPGWVEHLHLLKNRTRLMELFSGSGKVAAVFCGHYHEGDCQIVDGVPYITFAAVCEGTTPTGALVSVEENNICVNGIGGQKSMVVPTGNWKQRKKGRPEC